MNNPSLTPISKSTLQECNAPAMAKLLLGKYIVSNIDSLQVIGKIVETEAYQAPEDKASHAYNNKLTPRTSTMFESGGIAYIYLCYGIHHMLNVVTAPKGFAHAVLIRAIEPIAGVDIIMQRRKLPYSENLCNGPGKLCIALGLNYQQHNGIDLCDNKSPLWIADQENIHAKEIIEGPRVGVAYAQECALWPWRFKIKNHKWTSPPEVVNYQT